MQSHNSNKKVAQIVGRYLPLTQTFIYEYLKNLSCFEPQIFTGKTENLDLFPLDTINLLPKRTVLAKAIDKLSERTLGYKYLHADRYISPFKHLNIGLIHAHFGWCAPSMLPVKESLNIPLITTFYGADMSALPNRPGYMRAYRKLFKAGDAFLVEGSHMKNELAKLGCPVEKIRIQHIGIDLDKFPFNTRTTVKGSGTVRILMCNSFVEKKGTAVAIMAFAKSLNHFNNMELRIIGDGILMAQITNLVKQLKIDNKVKLLGYQNHQFYRNELNKAHIFMAPSQTASTGETEGGAPTVLLEAQASGLPVLSTFHADIPEVVENNGSGFLVPEQDAKALSERLSELIDSPERWAALGARGRDHVKKNYNIINEVKNLEKIYDTFFKYN